MNIDHFQRYYGTMSGIDFEKAETFAALRGWLIGRAFPLVQLREGRGHWRKSDRFRDLYAAYREIDHPVYLREPTRPYLPVAIVAHPYDNDLAHHRTWAAPELTAEPLDDNWYGVGTVGVIYTRNAAVARRDAEFARLCAAEPGLRRLRNRVDHHRAFAPILTRVCANELWYGQGSHAGIKPQLVRLVGWEARALALRTSTAYDTAYRYLYARLPDCRGDCGCFPPAVGAA